MPRFTPPEKWTIKNQAHVRLLKRVVFSGDQKHGIEGFTERSGNDKQDSASVFGGIGLDRLTDQCGTKGYL
jgi:hypothetical protein